MPKIHKDTVALKTDKGSINVSKVWLAFMLEQAVEHTTKTRKYEPTDNNPSASVVTEEILTTLGIEESWNPQLEKVIPRKKINPTPY